MLPRLSKLLSHSWVHPCGSLPLHHLLPVRMLSGLQPGQQPVSAACDIKQASPPHTYLPPTQLPYKGVSALLPERSPGTDSSSLILFLYVFINPQLSQKGGGSISNMYNYESLHFTCMHRKQRFCSLVCNCHLSKQHQEQIRTPISFSARFIRFPVNNLTSRDITFLSGQMQPVMFHLLLLKWEASWQSSGLLNRCSVWWHKMKAA